MTTITKKNCPVRPTVASSGGSDCVGRTLIHTARSDTGAEQWDEIWVEAVNADTVQRMLTIEFGGTTSPDDRIVVGIAAQSGLVLVVNGLILTTAVSFVRLLRPRTWSTSAGGFTRCRRDVAPVDAPDARSDRPGRSAARHRRHRRVPLRRSPSTVRHGRSTPSPLMAPSR